MSAELVNQTIEIEGRTFAVVVRRQDGAPVAYSFDGGGDFRPTIAEAYVAAKDAGKLVEGGVDVGPDGEFEAFAAAMVVAMASLHPGERLIVARGEARTVVLRESVVAEVRSSAIREARDRYAGEGLET